MRTFLQFLNEISKEDIAKIGKQVNIYSKKEFEDLPFNHIFGDKARIVIPMLDEHEQQFKNNIENLGYRVDLKKGMAYSQVQTQQGTKERSQKIGKLFQNLIRNRPQDSDFWKDQAHWWEKNRDKIGRVGEAGVSIIVSRHPIDIVRMSDHSEFSSCHAPGQSFFKCAIQEAKTGGAVAYIVRNSDLKQINNLQKKDIFEDPDREIEGVEPLERIRLRRFSDKNTNLLVPELRTYGIRHVGFYEAVKDWALNAQGIDPKNPPDLRKFDLYGGSYQDNDASELWNSFFGTDYRAGKKSVDQPEEGSKDINPDYLYNQAEQQRDEHAQNWKYFDVHFDVEEDERPILWYNAYTSFSFPKNEFIQELDEKDLNYGRESLGELITNSLDIYVIEDISLNQYKGNIIIQLDIQHEPDGYYQRDQLEEFESFLDEIDYYDRDYNKNYTKLHHLLIEEGYLRNWMEDLNLQNMEVDVDDKDGEVEVRGQFEIGYLMGLQKDAVERIFGSLSSVQKNLRPELFSKIFPKFIPPNNIFVRIDKKYLGHYMGLDDKDIIQAPIKISIVFDLEIPHDPVQRKKIIVGLNYLDKNWEYYRQRGIQFWNQAANIIKQNENKPFNLFGQWPKLSQVPLIKTPRPKPEFQQMELPFGKQQEKPQEESFKIFLKKKLSH